LLYDVIYRKSNRQKVIVNFQENPIVSLQVN
jgi:hypothetical protein